MALRPIRLRDPKGRFQRQDQWFNVGVSGPLFDGTGQKAFDRAKIKMSKKVATAAQRHIQTIGASNFRYEAAPATHFFVNNVEVERVSDGHLVHADQVIYGSWLEGTSSRNVTTRFKGYSLFRRAAQDTQRRLGDILTPEERDLARALNGTGVRTGPVL